MPPAPLADALDALIGHSGMVNGSWQTQALFTQHPTWKHAKQARPQIVSSQGPAGGMHIIPDDELAKLELDDATVELTLETLADELTPVLELLVVELVDIPPALSEPPLPGVPPAPPEPASVPVPAPSCSPLGNVSEPSAQLAATVVTIPKASNKPAAFCTCASISRVSPTLPRWR